MKALFALALLSACSAGPLSSPKKNEDTEHDWPSLGGVDAEIIQIMEEDRVPGLSTCLVSEGEVRWCGAYGERDAEAGLPVRVDTPFMLASLSKTVTAVAVMQAVEEGALDLDDDVRDIVDFEVTHPETPEEPITARRLLSHSSGIADNWDVLDSYYVDGDSPVALGDFLQSYLSPGGEEYSASQNFLRAGVGGRAEYSNVGVALAGYLVEPATGEAFDDRCDERIFEPLGMQAGWHLADFEESEVARPHRVREGEFQTIDHYGFPDYPDGQLRSDALSMARFAAALVQGGELEGERVLREGSVEELWTAPYPELDDTQGLAWYSWRVGGEEVWGHNGGDFGAATELIIRSSDGAAVVVLMNGEGTWATLEDVELAVLDGLDRL